MYAFVRPTALLVVVGALAAATAGAAAADTNKSQQTSNISGPIIPLLSPAGARPDNGQTSRQFSDKAYTTNWAVLDYFGPW
ncbi:hypothetical protein [Streptomyces poonensis]|uniref:Uncharacterized protein n=1 Tax=Streptomyces poonensis TaxID=68255 RepID=A0A918PBA8_9ACTN|nr:hypothetical protein [Streptomyces poonensis]GGY95805.1 hypothetical protein GCM10010365_13380 [Streptomyces poonensis]GLJ88869.1 hypothetical protein GCM10017589_14690 [Streptomyces poonensis]